MTEASDEFEAIYQSHAPLIYRFMFWRTQDEALSEDLTSSVFEKAWRARGSFHGGSAKAWLYKIAHNTLIDHWRKAKELVVDDVEGLMDAADTADPATVLDHELLRARLEQALIRLPADMRAVVELRFLAGCSCRQTARRLGLSEANVRVIQYRALRKLKGTLE